MFDKRFVGILAAVILLAMVDIHYAVAVGLNYVDANANPFAPPINLTGDVFTLSSPSGIGDGHWDLRTYGAGGSIYESGGAASEVSCIGCTPEGSPEIMQTVSGLTPGNSYDLYAVYWSADGQNWHLRAGTASGNLILYNRTGVGAVAGTYASSAVWDTLPPANSGAMLFHEADRSMLLAFAGTAVANGSGEVAVFVNDLPGSGTQRSSFDGVAFVAANTPIALTTTVDRTTGNISIENPTSNSFQIKAYSIGSAAGSLDATDWRTISNHDGGNGLNSSFDSDIWNVLMPTNPAATPYGTQLSEEENVSGGSSGGTLASGGSLNIGNVWHKTPFQDVIVNLTLADNSAITIRPEYTGAAVTSGDLDGSGNVNLTDFATLLTNLHTTVTPATTLAAAYHNGDLTGDRAINFDDFRAFRTAYDAQNGAGSFDQLLTQLPEPGGALLLITVAAMVLARIRRIGRRGLGLALCLLLPATSHAVPLLMVDMNDRTMADTPNSVTGFNPFALTGTTAAVPTPVTQTIGGYSVTLAPWDDGTDGNPVGQIDDRDRDVPTDGGSLTFAQIYDDFIFAGASVGPSGGMDLTVTGGALQPNREYTLSIYSYDGGAVTTTTRRTATWHDRNNADNVVLHTDWIDDVPPATNDTYKFTGVARTDALGKLWVRGRGDAADASQNPPLNNGPPVYINGFEFEDLGPVIDLTLEVNTTSGAVRIVNEQGINFTMSYYEVRSASGALNLGGWTSFDEAEGGDPVGTGWDEAGGNSANVLSEVNLTAQRTFAPTNTAALGSAFMPGGMQDVLFLYAPPDSTLKQGIVKYVTGTSVAGDYNGNGVLDAADYAVWRDTLNQNVTPGSGADGDGNGTVQTADYNFWRGRFGNTAGSGVSAGVGANVPEPATLGLLIFVTLLSAVAQRSGTFSRRMDSAAF